MSWAAAWSACALTPMPTLLLLPAATLSATVALIVPPTVFVPNPRIPLALL